MTDQKYVIGLDKIGLADLDAVGGKNASLGELMQNLAEAGVQVPGGFATTSLAFQDFLQENALSQQIDEVLTQLDVDNISQLHAAGQKIRHWILEASLPLALQEAIGRAYQQLATQFQGEFAVAVRSSATAEDLPEASFAGQQETFLNISGLDNVLVAIKHVYASLYNDRAIAYRVHQQFAHADVSLSVGVQLMVRSDLAASGVMFSVDTESGYDKVVFITSSYGLGEAVVQGSVNPDEFYVHKSNLPAERPAILRRNLGSKLEKMIYNTDSQLGKTITTVPVEVQQQRVFSLTDAEVEQLARYAVAIERHYGRPMDIEWAKDGLNNKLYILQARPETVRSQETGQVLRRYELQSKGPVRVSGRAIGQRVGRGPARIIQRIAEMDKVQPGDVLVTDMTDPDWEPIMKRAAAIVTNRGGRTCHAAIIAREMGIPAVVGCGDATHRIKEGEQVTVSCAEGETGYVYSGELDYRVSEVNVEKMPDIPCKIMMNIANPDKAFQFCQLPNSGVGLARLEFIINTMIGIHPKALLDFASLTDKECQARIADLTAAYRSPVDFYVQRLVEGIATLGSSFAPQPVIVRLSDFKSNEYANLLGGELYEPHEENPMLGFRGASRYISPEFQECFALECQAIKIVREQMGFENVQVMIPFVRTVAEAQAVTEVLRQQGLERGKNNLKLIMMCELPANALLAEQFLQYFDGFSIGSNDMTQLTLGLDRDSGLVAELFDERNDAVKLLLRKAIQACKAENKYIGICGQGPSDHADLASWLIDEGIESMSLNPDTVIETWLHLA